MISQQLLNRPLAQHKEVTQLATAIRDSQHAEIAIMMGCDRFVVQRGHP
jgi:uncharacterized protein (DUF305 family)